MSNLTGQSFGRYRILEQIGKGGMATVYKAYDTHLDINVAVKVIRTDNLPQNAVEHALKRFEREAKTLARLTHPNIVKVTDYGNYEDNPYLVMSYLPGGTLRKKMREPLPWQEAIQSILPIAEALDFAHSQNMIHHDVKPSNILLTQRGQPMLTDFGIVKLLDFEETMDLTGTSATVGTPNYMAPEQATAKTVDHRVDIYSLGIVFYEMVTGRKPFTADTPLAILIKHANDPLPRPKQYIPNLPDDVEKVLLKALAKKPEKRYQNMGEFVAALIALQERKREFNIKHIIPTIPILAIPKLERILSWMPKVEIAKKRAIIFYLMFSVVLICTISFIRLNSSAVFFSGITTSGEFGIYSYDGKKITIITQTAEGEKNGSPVTGYWGSLYYVSNQTGKSEIYGVNNRGEVWQVTKTPGRAESWAPAIGFGGNMYFTSNRTGKAEIYGFNSKGEVWQVTKTPGQAESWAPVIQGQTIYFTSNRSGKNKVYVLKPYATAISEMESWTKTLNDHTQDN